MMTKPKFQIIFCLFLFGISLMSYTSFAQQNINTRISNEDAKGAWIAKNPNVQPAAIMVNEGDLDGLRTYLISDNYFLSDQLEGYLDNGVLSVGYNFSLKYLSNGDLIFSPGQAVYTPTPSADQVFREIKEAIKKDDFRTLEKYIHLPFRDSYAEVYTHVTNYQVETIEDLRAILPKLFSPEVKKGFIKTKGLVTYEERLKDIEDGNDMSHTAEDIVPYSFDIFVANEDDGLERAMIFIMTLTDKGYKLVGLEYTP